MLTCPRCDVPLCRGSARPGILWQCRSCGGQAATVGVLRKHIPRKALDGFLRDASGSLSGDCACPSCTRPMRVASPRTETGGRELDYCRSCQFLWCDAGEYEALPRIPAKEERPLSPAAREALGRARHGAMTERPIPDGDFGREPVPGRAWLFGVFTRGADEYVSDLAPRAWATLGLAGTMMVATCFAPAAMDSDLVAGAPWRIGGSTLLTHAFTHRSFLHLLSDFYLLWLFVRPVEYREGAARTLALFTAGTLVGGLVFAFWEPRPHLALVGPAAGLSAFACLYAARFPRASISWLIGFGLVYRWVRVPAGVLTLVWLLMQATLDVREVKGRVFGSMLAALGGAAVAVAFLVVDRSRARARRRRSVCRSRGRARRR